MFWNETKEEILFVMGGWVSIKLQKNCRVELLWGEGYVYGEDGKRTTKITPYGKIEYTYDRENCLLSSGSKGQAFINYNYDAMGNLLTEESAGKTTKYAYNAQNRLVYCEVTDRANKEYAQTIYAYDAFGRRIIVQDKGEAALRTLYDGLTFDIIKQSPTFENGQFTDSQNTGIKFGSTGRPTGDRYRYLGDDETKDNNHYFYLDENTYKTTSSRYRGERTTINVNGTLAAQTTTEGTDYFSTDLLGSVTSITDTYGSKKSGYTYDAFGTLVQGNLTGTTDHGYLGKQKDPTTKLYNYGYRDYKPQTARFTTVDPIRDGSNWFSYCNGDPVNFVDLWGLEVEKIFSSYKMQDSRWGSDKLNGDSKYNMSGYGCANTLIANIDSSIGGTLTPKDINNTYCEDGSAQWQKYAEDHNMTVNKKNTPLTKEQFDALDYSNDRYYIGAEVVYTNDNHTHFVGINNIRNIEGKDYYEISETSDNDGVVGLESLRGGAGWIKEGDKVYAPVENVKSAVIFKKNK